MDITARDRIFSNPKVEYSKYYDPAHEENWVVDFEGVAKCFLLVFFASSLSPY
jgi:hypothetical protein